MGWDVWGDLARREHITVAMRALPAGTGGAIYAQCGADAVVIIDPRLPRQDREAALAHELVHDERGVACDDPEMPPGWRAVVRREGHAVDREVARRMVPVDELRDVIEAWLGLADGPIEAHHVADHFDVAEWVAEVAMRELLRREGAA